MSAYTDFVKQHIGKVRGSTQKEKMQAVAALWREQKQKAGDGMTAPLKGGGKRKIAAVADEEDGGQMLGGCVEHGSQHRRMHGGSANPPLGAANQIGGGPLGMVTNLLGLGVQQPMQGGRTFNEWLHMDKPQNGEGWLDTVGDIAKTAGSFVPLAMLAL